MQDHNNKLYSDIIRKIKNPILLFSIFFGLLLLSIGVYDINRMTALRYPLLVVFALGLVGSICLQLLVRHKKRAKSGHN